MKAIYSKVYCQINSEIKKSKEGFMAPFTGQSIDDLYRWVSRICTGCTSIIKQKDKVLAMFDDSTLVTSIQRCEEYYIKNIDKQLVNI